MNREQRTNVIKALNQAAAALSAGTILSARDVKVLVKKGFSKGPAVLVGGELDPDDTGFDEIWELFQERVESLVKDKNNGETSPGMFGKLALWEDYDVEIVDLSPSKKRGWEVATIRL